MHWTSESGQGGKRGACFWWCENDETVIFVSLGDAMVLGGGY